MRETFRSDAFRWWGTGLGPESWVDEMEESRGERLGEVTC
jgi:hypothetical protein